jgi:membrane protease YdiL (CAAX protease family)
MRPIRSLLIYLVFVFVGGALLAPWLYWFAHSLAAQWPAFSKLAANPFSRFVVRSILGLALLGLWPLLRSCRMLTWHDLGLTVSRRSPANAFLGFLLGFASLALVAALSLLLRGRTFNPNHTPSQMAGHFLGAAAVALIVAVLEEILFRGSLFGLLRKIVSWPKALVLSSAVYALAHFLQKSAAPQNIDWTTGLALLPKMFCSGTPLLPAVLTLFIAGAILALAYQRTGALFFSMGLHAGWIFWLRFYGFFTVTTPSGNPAIWGSDKLIDGWLALPVLAALLWAVSRMTLPPEKPRPA